MICKNCGCEFQEGMFCSECGTKYEETEIDVTNEISNDGQAQEMVQRQSVNESPAKPSKEKSRKKQLKNHGIISIICGILGWILILTVIGSLVLGAVAIVNSFKAIKNKEKYRKCAIIGMLLGIAVYAFIIWVCVQPSSTSSDSLASSTVTSENEEYTENDDINESDSLYEDSVEETDAIQKTEYLEESETEIIEESETETTEENNMEQDDFDDEDDAEYRTVTISIDYEKSSAILAYRDDGIVYLDGDDIGTIEYGKSESFTVLLEDGTHKLKLKSDTTIRNHTTNTLKLKVSADNTYFSVTASEGAIKGLQIELD